MRFIFMMFTYYLRVIPLITKNYVESETLLKNWKIGIAKTYFAFTINEQEEELPFDWVRRMDIGRFPFVVCGSASGSIYVADVEKKQIVVEARNVHSSHQNGSVD